MHRSAAGNKCSRLTDALAHSYSLVTIGLFDRSAGLWVRRWYAKVVKCFAAKKALGGPQDLLAICVHYL